MHSQKMPAFFFSALRFQAGMAASASRVHLKMAAKSVSERYCSFMAKFMALHGPPPPAFAALSVCEMKREARRCV